MNIAFIANPLDNHDCKWINVLANIHCVHIICTPYSKKLKSYVKNDNIQIHEILPLVFPYKNPIAIWKKAHQLKKLINNYDIDLVHSMYAYPNSIYGYLSGLSKHVITTRGSDILVDYQKFLNGDSLKEKMIYSILSWYMRKSLNKASVITSTSLGQRKAIERIVSNSDKCLLIRTGIDTTLFDVEPLSNNGIGYRIFSPRSMKSIYQIELIVEGFAECLQGSKESYTLVILDDFPESDYSSKIRKMVSDLSIESCIEFLPSLQFSEMIQQYLKSDIVIMTPKSDGTPNSALEAMYLKKPVILGALPYDEDLFNDNSIWKLSRNEPGEIKRVINEILQLDKTDKMKKLNNAHDIVEKNATLESAIQQINGLYHNLVKDA